MKTITIETTISTDIVNSIKELVRANGQVSAKMYATAITLKTACASMSVNEKQALSAIKKAVMPEKWGVSNDQWKHLSAVVQSWTLDEITSFRDNGFEFSIVYEGRKLTYSKVVELGSRKAIRDYLKSLKEGKQEGEKQEADNDNAEDKKGTNCPYTKAELLKFIMDKGLYQEFVKTMEK